MLDTDCYEEQGKELNLEKLLNEARELAKLSDYGDMAFVEPMARALERVVCEVNFNAKGLKIYKADIIRFLVNRLRMHADIQRHPEILQEDVSDPVIIIGLGRSGTTKLQRMLAVPSNVQKLYMWRMLNPAPFPDAVPGQKDPRIAASGMGGVMAAAFENEAVLAGHDLSADEVDEEYILFDFTFDDSVSGFSVHLPLFYYEDWKEGKPDRNADREAYRYVRTLLQYLQWQDSGKRNRPWILKAVTHIAHMDTLLECFPDATLVHCHRDPHNAIPSFAKMLWLAWSARTNVAEKLKFSGQQYLKWSTAAINRYLEARDRLGLNDRILDVQYESIRNDAMLVVREIYKCAGRELKDEDILAMTRWEANNEQGKLGKHYYSLEEFGIGKERINRAFAEYIHRFIDR